MSGQLTKKVLDNSLENLARIFNKEFTGLRSEMNTRFDAVNKRLDTNDKKFDRLIKSLDKYTKTVENWHDESKILAAQIDKIKKVLIEKSIATEQELSLIGK